MYIQRIWFTLQRAEAHTSVTPVTLQPEEEHRPTNDHVVSSLLLHTLAIYGLGVPMKLVAAVTSYMITRQA